MTAGETNGHEEEAPPELPRDLGPELLAAQAEEHGTPLYVTSAGVVRDRYREAREAFPAAEIQYAAKANANPRILEVLEELGSSVDAVSLGEVVAAERAGFTCDRIGYTGAAPRDGELAAVLERGLRVNVNWARDLERVARLAVGTASGAGGEAPPGAGLDGGKPGAGGRNGRAVGIRMNPAVGAGHHAHVVTGEPGSKFGVPRPEIVDAFRTAAGLGLRPAGLHMHIGSGYLDPAPLLRAADALAGAAREVEEAGFELEWVDAGGGWGVPYRPGEERLDLAALGRGLRERLETDAMLVVEPGRYLVAESTVLLTRVTSRAGDTVGVDAGLHTLLRPALYGAYHHVSNLSRPEAERRPTRVVGPVCEEGDVLAEGRVMAAPEPGDLLAVHAAGAYGYAMASHYNARRLPAEVLVDGEPRLIRRREPLDDLFRHVV